LECQCQKNRQIYFDEFSRRSPNFRHSSSSRQLSSRICSVPNRTTRLARALLVVIRWKLCLEIVPPLILLKFEMVLSS
jgi:hypothetical protein